MISFVLRRVAALASLAMVASIFFVWVDTPFGAPPTPYQAFSEVQSNLEALDISLMDALSELGQSTPGGLLAVVAFGVSIAGAAVFGVLGLAGFYPKIMRWIVGLLAACLALTIWVQLDDLLADALPILGEGLREDLASQAMEFLSVGAYLYFGGGAIVLLTALVGRR